MWNVYIYVYTIVLHPVFSSWRWICWYGNEALDSCVKDKSSFKMCQCGHLEDLRNSWLELISRKKRNMNSFSPLRYSLFRFLSILFITLSNLLPLSFSLFYYSLSFYFSPSSSSVSSTLSCLSVLPSPYFSYSKTYLSLFFS